MGDDCGLGPDHCGAERTHRGAWHPRRAHPHEWRVQAPGPPPVQPQERGEGEEQDAAAAPPEQQRAAGRGARPADAHRARAAQGARARAADDGDAVPGDKREDHGACQGLLSRRRSLEPGGSRVADDPVLWRWTCRGVSVRGCVAIALCMCAYYLPGWRPRAARWTIVANGLPKPGPILSLLPSKQYVVLLVE